MTFDPTSDSSIYVLIGSRHGEKQWLVSITSTIITGMMKTSLLYFIKCFPIPSGFHHPDIPIDRYHFCRHVAIKEMEAQRSQVLCSRSYKELGPNSTYSKFISFPECHSLPYFTSVTVLAMGKLWDPLRVVVAPECVFLLGVFQLQSMNSSLSLQDASFCFSSFGGWVFCFCFCFVHQHQFLGLLKEINSNRIKVLAPKSDIGWVILG